MSRFSHFTQLHKNHVTTYWKFDEIIFCRHEDLNITKLRLSMQFFVMAKMISSNFRRIHFQETHTTNCAHYINIMKITSTERLRIIKTHEERIAHSGEIARAQPQIPRCEIYIHSILENFSTIYCLLMCLPYW